MMSGRDKHEEQELELEREEIRVLRDIDRTEHEILHQLRPRLTFIKIAFSRGEHTMEGPVTLTVGQKTVASIDGFDQNGAPFTGPIPTPTFSLSDTSMDSVDAAGNVTSLAPGTDNLTATLTTADGRTLTDTETITNLAQAPVLSSIKINFSTPA